MRIEIRDLRIEAIIGILPEERHTPQPILVDLEADYRYDGERFLDYAALAEWIRRTLVEGKFGLLEEALMTLKEGIFDAHPFIDRLSLRLSKPEILPNCRVAVSDSWVLPRF